MTEEIIDYKKECSNLLAEKNALLCRYEEIRADLQRLKQENEKLKKAYNEISNNSEILHENDRLRIANTKLNEDLSQTEISMREWKEQSIKYRSALEEIKEIVNQSCDNCKYNKDDITCSIGDCGEGKLKIIENKINEVLSNEV